jgi:mercuric ion transport protein
MNSRNTLIASMLAGIGASACCVGPLVLVMLGIGGTWIANLTKLEPYRPVFVVITLALLALAFHRLYLKPASCEPGKPCADTKVIQRQRWIFWLVAIPVLALLAFPWYAPLFY